MPSVINGRRRVNYRRFADQPKHRKHGASSSLGSSCEDKHISKRAKLSSFRKPSTSFASAILPLSTNTGNIKHSRPTTPLLSAMGASTHHIKRPRFLNSLSPKKVVPPSSSSGGGQHCKSNAKKKSDSIRRIIFANSPYLNRGGNNQKNKKSSQAPTSSYAPFHSENSPGSIETNSAKRVVVVSNTNTNNRDEHITNSGDIEPMQTINTCTRLTPLSFDDTGMMNHFRSLDQSDMSGSELGSRRSMSPSCNIEDFSLQRVLTPASSQSWLSLFVDEAADDVILEEIRECSSQKSDDSSYEEFLQILNDSSDSEEIYQDDIAETQTPLHRIQSNHSIPSLSDHFADDVTDHDNKKRVPVNLLQDDDAAGEDLDVITLQQDNDELINELQALTLNVQEGLTDFPDNCSIPSVSSETQLDDEELVLPDIGCPTGSAHHNLNNNAVAESKKEAADHTLALTVLGAILGSPAPSSLTKKKKALKRYYLCENNVDDEIDLIPEIDDPVDIDEEIDLNELIDNVDKDIEVKSLVDAKVELHAINKNNDDVLAWSALSMILGSPSPKSVSQSNRRKRPSPEVARNLFSDFNEVDGVNDMDTIPSIEPDEEEDESYEQLTDPCQEENDDDDHSVPSLSDIPSLSGTYYGEDDDPSTPLSTYDNFILSSPSICKEQADDVLAWSMLSMILSSPAPKATSTLNKRRQGSNLWSCGECVEDFQEF